MRHVVAAAVAALLLPALAGCGGDEAPKASPAPSASSSAAPSSAPTLPAEAQGTGPKAAEAFVRHYVDLINHSLATLDGSPLRALADRGCGLCSGFADIVEDVGRRGGHFEGGQWSIKKLNQRPHGAADERNIQAFVRVASETIQHSEGGKTSDYPQREAYFNFIVRFSSDGPRMARIDGVAQ